MAILRAPWSRFVAAAGLLAGCHSGAEVALSGGTTSGGTTSGGTTSSGGSGGSTSASSSSGTGGAFDGVSGTCVDHWYLADGTFVDRPVDLSAGIQALVQQGSQWVTFTGTGAVDGSFAIPGVPEGPYLVSPLPNGDYAYTAERVLDLGIDWPWRPDAVQAVNSEIAGNVTGLAPWSDRDAINWVSPNSGGASSGPVGGAGPYPGATTLSWPYSYGGGLVDGSKGDVLYLTQSTTQPGPVAPISLTTITRFASFTGLEQMSTGALAVTGTFTQSPTDEALAIDFRGSQFAAQALAANPNATGASASMEVDVGPNAGAIGSFSAAAILLALSPAVPGDVNLGTVSYTDPFPVGWGQTLKAGASATVSYAVPGASPLLLQTGVGIAVPAEQLGAGPIVPLLGPVQDPQVNGQDAFGPLTGISLPVTLTWKPPSLGQATSYTVVVSAVTNVGGVAGLGLPTIIATTATSLTLPPAMASTGTTYLFHINAAATPNDVGKQPFRGSGSEASSDVVTSLLAL